MTTNDTVLRVLTQVTGTDQVRRDPDLRLYDLHLLDSLRTVELIVAFSEKLGVEISPADFDRDRWATPRLIVQDLESRIGQ